MTKVFISYSRKDKGFAEQLNLALKKIQLESWIDWDDIPPTADWWDQIQKGIETADAFLFLLSPDSVKSQVCEKEIDHAVKNGKRLIPIVVRDVTATEVHPALTKLNWIFLREQDDFTNSLNKLEAGIKTDLAWVEAHRRLQVRAVEWEKRKERSLLLRGKDLREAEEQLAAAGQKDPLPTDLQRQYGLESRRGESRTRNVLLALGALVIVALALLSIFALDQRNLANNNALTAIANENSRATAQVEAENQKGTAVANEQAAVTAQANAETQARISRAGELAAQSVLLQNNLPEASLSQLLSVEALRTADIYRTESVLLDSLQTNPRLLRHLYGNTDAVKSVAFSHNGEFLAASSCAFGVWPFPCGRGEILIWDLSSGQPVGKSLKAENFDISSLAFSPDDKTLASSGCQQRNNQEKCIQGEIILWDISTQARIGEPLTGPADWVSRVAFSPDGTILASGGTDGSLMLWNIQTRQPLGAPLTTGAWISGLVFSLDGKTLASTSDRSTIILWNVETHQPINQPLQGYTLTFTPNGAMTASISDKVISLWDVTAEKSIGQIETGITKDIKCLIISPDGQTMAACEDNHIYLWDLATLKSVGTLSSGNTNGINSLAFSTDSKQLVSGSFAEVIVWKTQLDQPIGQLLTNNNHSINVIKFSPDGKVYATGGCGSKNVAGTCDQGEVRLWDSTTDQPINQPLLAGSVEITSLAFNPLDLNMIAAGNSAGTVVLWDLKSNKPIGQPLNGNGEALFELAFTPDGKKLITASLTKIMIWQIAGREPIGQQLMNGVDNLNLALSPDGKLLAVASQYGDQVGGNRIAAGITLWDVSTYKPIGDSLTIDLGELMGWSYGNQRSLAFSPNGKIIAVDSISNTTLLWDVETSQPIGQPITGIQTTSLAFSPIGNYLALSGYDSDGNSNLVLWDLKSGQPLGPPLKSQTYSLGKLVFSPDGLRLASVDDKGAFMMWNLDPHLWAKMICQRVGRNLTQTEWELYFSTQAYRKTCAEWPNDTGYLDPTVRQILSTPNANNRVQRALEQTKIEFEKDPTITDPDLESALVVSKLIYIKFIRTNLDSEDFNEAISLVKQAEKLGLEMPYKQMIQDQISGSPYYDPKPSLNTFPRALELLDIAKALDLNITEVDFFERTCRFGSIQGYAKSVIEYCEHAVQLSMEDPSIRDSRGLARTLTGDFEGAILDFRFFIENSASSELIAERQRWITELEVGKNPLTPAVLEKLKQE